jgi:hypothetical protein
MGVCSLPTEPETRSKEWQIMLKEEYFKIRNFAGVRAGLGRTPFMETQAEYFVKFGKARYGQVYES